MGKMLDSGRHAITGQYDKDGVVVCMMANCLALVMTDKTLEKYLIGRNEVPPEFHRPVLGAMGYDAEQIDLIETGGLINPLTLEQSAVA